MKEKQRMQSLCLLRSLWLGQFPQPRLALLTLAGTPAQPHSQGFIELLHKSLSFVREVGYTQSAVGHTQRVPTQSTLLRHVKKPH